MPVRFSPTDNPMWPLPRDYEELDTSGQKLARLNVVFNRSTPADDVTSWAFFRNYYLNHEQAAWFDSWRDPAPGHFEWAHICARYERVMIAAHRGSAKSTIFSGEFILRDLLTRPNSKTALVNATMPKITDRFEDLMRQIEHNERILEDFGTLKPDRYKGGLWNHQLLVLRNGAKLQGFSVESKGIRGIRPHRIVVDDPEYDPKEGTSIEKIIAKMDTLLFSELLPSLRPGCRLHWIGTPISARLFLWRMIEGGMGGLDPRLDPARWFRRVYPGLADDTDDVSAFWPSENPPERIREMRREMGTRWGPEFLCRPSEGIEKPLIIVPDLHYYGVTSGDPILNQTPLADNSVVTYGECTPDDAGGVKTVRKTSTAGDLYRGMLRFVTVDAIRNPSPTSDWAAIHTMGVDGVGAIWSLDLWLGKVTYGPLARKLWEYVHKWRPRAVGVESYAMELHLYNEIKESAERFAQEFGWVPQIKPIRYPQGVKKEDRIQGLGWRFRRGLVKLPSWKLCEMPYSMLLHQIQNFTPDGTGLDHDDAVDSLAMAQEMVPANASVTSEDPIERTLLSLMRSGEKYLAPGIPLLTTVPLECIPEDVLQTALNEKYEQEIGEPQRTVSACGSSLLGDGLW